MNLLFVVLLMQGVSSFQARNQPTGISLSSLALPSLDGSVVSFASFKGKPTLLAFFAPWCGVCKAQAPNLRWLKGLLGDRVNVVSVAASYQKIEAVKAYAAEHEQGLPVLIEGDALAAKLKVSAFPTVYFLDREGRVKRSAVGYTTTLGLMARLLL